VQTVDAALLNDALLVVATVVVLVIATAVIQRMYRVAHGAPERPEDPLTALQTAYIKGEIDEAEFRRVQESLERRKNPKPPDNTPPTSSAEPVSSEEPAVPDQSVPPGPLA
jgi:hypothetical protein